MFERDLGRIKWGGGGGGGGGGATVKIHHRPVVVRDKTNPQKACSGFGRASGSQTNLVPRVFLMVLKMSSRRSKKPCREDPAMRFKGR